MKFTIICQTCGTEKQVKDKWLAEVQKFCSRSCKRYSFTNETKIKMSKSRIGSGNPFYGKKHSEKTRKYWGEIRKGKLYPQAIEAMVAKTKGKPLSSEMREKLSIAAKGKAKPWIQGEKHPFWKGGISNRDIHSLNNPQYRKWRMDVFTRDKFTCHIADKNCRGMLQAHHILRWADYPELRYKLNNGITLCQGHHPRKKKDEAELSLYFKKLVAEMN